MKEPFGFMDPGKDKAEWEHAWSAFTDREMYNGELGEALQYMGSVKRGSGWKHEFRHRAVPGTNQRQYWSMPASEGWVPAADQCFKLG